MRMITHELRNIRLSKKKYCARIARENARDHQLRNSIQHNTGKPANRQTGKTGKPANRQTGKTGKPANQQTGKPANRPNLPEIFLDFSAVLIYFYFDQPRMQSASLKANCEQTQNKSRMSNIIWL